MSLDSPFGSGRHARSPRKRWRSGGLLLSPVASVRTRPPDLAQVLSLATETGAWGWLNAFPSGESGLDLQAKAILGQATRRLIQERYDQPVMSNLVQPRRVPGFGRARRRLAARQRRWVRVGFAAQERRQARGQAVRRTADLDRACRPARTGDTRLVRHR